MGIVREANKDGLENLEIYRMALELSALAWTIYNHLPKELRYTMGNQLLDAADSVGANIAEGFGRFHYRDSLKFYYNARGSLLEFKHWTNLVSDRKLMNADSPGTAEITIDTLGRKLNSFINSLKIKVSNYK
jgi:four helix bundle protein